MKFRTSSIKNMVLRAFRGTSKISLRVSEIFCWRRIHTQFWAGEHGVGSSEIISDMREVFCDYSARILAPDALVDGETGHVVDVVGGEVEASGVDVGGARSRDGYLACSWNTDTVESKYVNGVRDKIAYLPDIHFFPA